MIEIITVDDVAVWCKNEYMFNKQDKKDLKEIMLDVCVSYFHEVIAPYLSREHDEIMQRFEKNDKEHATIMERLSGIDGKLEENDNDHERIFRALERNRDEHDQMFVSLDKIEKGLAGHEKRIRKVEHALAA